MTKAERLVITVMYVMGQISDYAMDEIYKSTKDEVFRACINEIRQKDCDAEWYMAKEEEKLNRTRDISQGRNGG